VGNNEAQSGASAPDQDSNPQYQPVDRLAPADPFELPAQLLLNCLGIAFIILIGFFVSLHLQHISHAGPVKDMYELKGYTQRKGGRVEPEPPSSGAFAAPPEDTTHPVVGENQGYDQGRNVQSINGPGIQGIDIHTHPLRSQARLHKGTDHGAKAGKSALMRRKPWIV
jgi:hypothetical protein